MDTGNISFAVAYIAGLTSFFSPCLIPLLPSYFSTITGFTFKELYGIEFRSIRTRVFISSLFFVAGFSLVYSLLGATGTIVGQFIQENLNLLIRGSGIFLILLGLVQLGIIKFHALEFDYAWNIQKKLARFGYLNALTTGIACALIWIPCVGQILGAMLLLASQADTAFRGLLLLFVFSLGLGTPFLLLGLFFPSVFTLLSAHRKFFYYLTKIAGVILVAFGIILLIGQYQYFIFSVDKAIFELEKLFMKGE